MKKLIFSLIGFIVVILLAFVSWNLFLPSSAGSEPAVGTESNTNVRTTTEDVDLQDTAVSEPQSELQTEEGAAETVEVDAIESSVVNAEEEAMLMPGMVPMGGRGGGGGYGYDEGPFANATLTLDADLPEGDETAVYAAPMQRSEKIDEAQLRAFAEKMGISGDVYFEWHSGMPADGQDDGSGNIPYVYRIFEGQKQVSAFAGGEWVYEDTTLYRQMETTKPLPFAERAAIAEQFLLEKGLLDFEYEMRSSWGNEVQFLSLINGRPIYNWPTITVNVTGKGQIMSVFYRPLNELTETEVADVRPAADAWQYLQETFGEGALMFNIIPSNPDYYNPYPPTEEKVHWEREFAPGQDITLTSWIQIYRPTDGSKTPRLITDRGIVLAADNDTLEAIAEAVGNGKNIRLQGTLSGEPTNLTLNVTDWEGVVGPIDVYLNGTTRQIDGTIVLELPGGFPIQIANPPADLPIDALMSMASWSVRVADDGVSAIADWVMLDAMNHHYVEPERPFADPYTNITNVTVNQVTLVYYYLYPYESLNPYSPIPYRANDNSHLVPVWRFSGETSNGDTVEFTIPALASEELPPPPTN